MAYAAWPTADVAFAPLIDSFKDELENNHYRFEPEAGKPIVRRKTSRRYDRMSCELVMSEAERQAFETFYTDTLKDGSLPFTAVHPITENTHLFYFDLNRESVSWETYGLKYRVRLALLHTPQSSVVLTQQWDFTNLKTIQRTSLVRNSLARYWDADGNLAYAQVNEPRPAYHPITGVLRGIMREPAAANLVNQSEGTGTITSVSGDVSEGANVDTGRGLVLNNITTTDSSGARAEVDSQSVFVTNDYFVSSVYVQKGSNISFELDGTLRDTDTGIQDMSNIQFNWAGAGGALQLVTGGFPLATGGATINGAGVEDCGSGLYRVWMHGQITATIPTTCRLWPRLASIVTTAGATDAIIAGGWQLEKVTGAQITRPTSYCKVGGGETGVREADAFDGIVPRMVSGPLKIVMQDLYYNNRPSNSGKAFALQTANGSSDSQLEIYYASGAFKFRVRGAGNVQLINLNLTGNSSETGSTFNLGAAVNAELTVAGGSYNKTLDTYGNRNTTNTDSADTMPVDMAFIVWLTGDTDGILGKLSIYEESLDNTTYSADMEAFLRSL